MKYRDYKVSKHNSTVCGYAGREFDWSKFCWDGGEVHVDKCLHPDCQHTHEAKAPMPFVDGCLIAPHCQYLHVPYDYAEAGTIYRVRPNPTMEAGQLYRGQLIERQMAIHGNGNWYWRLIFKD